MFSPDLHGNCTHFNTRKRLTASLRRRPRDDSGKACAIKDQTSDEFTVERCRRFYAEEIRIVAGLSSSALVEAFARVPREQFLGPPPWRYSSGNSLHSAGYQESDQPRDLYHDVFVALQSERFLNNGQPSLLARLLVALDLAAGKRVVHIGCGTGYYTAIMAEVVGKEGWIHALEIDPELAARAKANLAAYSNVQVVNGDGSAYAPEGADAILVNAGVTHPHPAWLNGLNEAGVLVTPLLVGRSLTSRDAVALRITRRGDQFAAEALTILTIYPSPSQCDPSIQTLMNGCFESHSLLRLRSLRMDAHEQNSSCLAHAPAFCLSAASVEAPSLPESDFDQGLRAARPELVL